jgi:hypothetical protein
MLNRHFMSLNTRSYAKIFYVDKLTSASTLIILTK